MEKVFFKDLGKVAYQDAWDYQQLLLRELVDRKLANRSRQANGEAQEARHHYLLFCEHPPVYTLGKSGSTDHLLLGEEALNQGGFEFFRINRGGDITYHGPGQIVGYPIFDLDGFFTDVHRYVRYLEEAVIRVLAEYQIPAERLEGYSGVWLPPKGRLPWRKICAIGVHLSRWVTMHGFAFNIHPELAHFRNIVPCGISDKDKEVTSLEWELGHRAPMQEVKDKLRRHFASLFGFEWM